MGSTDQNYDLEIAKPIPVTKSKECLLHARSNNDVRFRVLKVFLENVRKVVFETKLFVLFPAIPMAFVAHFYNFGNVSVGYLMYIVF